MKGKRYFKGVDLTERGYSVVFGTQRGRNVTLA